MSKAKARKKKLLISELTLTLSNSVFLMFNTQYASFTFASLLNRLYHWRLTREEDMAFAASTRISPLDYPLFSYYDEHSRLFYLLLDYSQTALSKDDYLSSYDKILVIIGEGGSEMMERIYSDFNEFAHRQVPPYDILAQRFDDFRMSILKYVSNVDFFDFSRPINDLLPDLSDDDYETIRISRHSEPAPYSQLALLDDFNTEQHQQEPKLSKPSSTKKHVFFLDDDFGESRPKPIPTTSLLAESDLERPQTQKAIALARKRKEKLEATSKLSDELLQTIELHLSLETVLPFTF